MDFLSFLTITISAYLGILIIITLHELGHAIPMALFTKKKTTIYLGSYGEKTGNLKFNIRLIDFNVKYKLWAWKGGLCVPSVYNLSLKQQIIFLLSGPIFPILILTLPVFIGMFFSLNEYLVAGFYFLLLLSIFHCISNLIPFTRTTNNGRVLLSDGYQLRWILSNKKFYNDYMVSVQAYNNKDYKKTADILSDIINNGAKGQVLYRLLLISYVQLKKYNDAVAITPNFIKSGTLSSDDYANITISYIVQEQYKKAEKLCKKSLKMNPKNVFALNNKAFIYSCQNKHEDAISLLDQAIKINSNFLYAYLNRGYAKIKSGNPEEGLKDLEKSYELDPENSNYYKNMGHYHFIKENYQKALDYFLKAKEKDIDTYKIDEDIEAVKMKL